MSVCLSTLVVTCLVVIILQCTLDVKSLSELVAVGIDYGTAKA